MSLSPRDTRSEIPRLQSSNTASRSNVSLLSSEPPGYSQISHARPSLPSQNPRYAPKRSNPQRSDTVTTTIQARSRPATYSEHKGNIPEGWLEFTHPEGDTYYFHSSMRLITPVDPRMHPEIDQIYEAFQLIVRRLVENYAQLDQFESFINITSYPGAESGIHYYLVDHENRTIFWAEEVKCQALGLPPHESQGQFKSMITPEYWTHVDYHPCHGKYPETAADELFGMLSHGSIDDTTSPGSTCPYGAEECRQYLSTLQSVANIKADMYRTACVARVWSAMARARHINSYGSDCARLDRFQGFEPATATPRKRNVLLMITHVFFFFIPVTIHARLAKLFNGRVVYQRHWHDFFQDLRFGWLLMGILGALTVIANAGVIAAGQGGVVAIASTSFAAAAVVAAVYLHSSHPEYKLKTGHDISTYVMQHEDYYSGLRPLSVLLALPQVLMIYSGILFYTTLIQIVMERTQSLNQAASAISTISAGTLPVLTASGYVPGYPPHMET